MIRFDTLNKKPKLWNVAALSGVLLAILAVLLLRGAERNAAAISLSLSAYLLIVLVLLGRAFCGQLRYNP